MRRRALLVGMIAAALPLLYMGQTLVLGQPLIRDDASLFFYPQFFRLAEATRLGQLYLWDAQQFAGMPVLAAGQAGSLYLPHLVAFRLLPWLTAVHALYWLHLAAAFLGFVWVARNMGAGRAGAVLGAIVYAFSGYQGAHLIHYSFVVAIAWLPVLLGLLQKALADHRPWLWGLWAVCLAGAFLSAAPQLLLMALVVCGLWLALGGWRREAQAGNWSRLAGVAGAGVIAALLAMPQFLPMWELMRQLREVDPGGPGGAAFMASYGFRASDLIRVTAADS